MPKNKQADLRYRVIDACLKNTSRTWTKLQLIEKVNERLFELYDREEEISERTFYDDLKVMRTERPDGFGAPIVCKRGFYSYSEPDFEIFKSGLSESDVDAINGAIELLREYPQLPIFEQLNLLKGKVTGQVLTENSLEPIIELEHRRVVGREFLTPLYNHIKRKHVIRLRYQSFNSAEKDHVLHPYFLKQYNHRWYLVALNEMHQSIGTYSLDRIKAVERIEEIMFNNSLNNNHAEHFKDVIGITLYSEKEPIEIIAEVSKSQKPYLKTKKLHSSQQILHEEDDAGMTISIKIIPNYEFYSTIRAAGDGIKIIGPVEVRDEIANQLKRASDQYLEK
ncbi:WYL domain-containing protein [Draconibacterium orientale]|uniref:helix-turn-helix transcriptional regulator n=1 Tax=Draconibacterium orientale TaxID=1168034 RepID=UPI0029C0BAD0|nr:WYL domain-containing protein [Draconibacterium orientale]